VARAFQAILSGRRGVAAIEMPWERLHRPRRDSGSFAPPSPAPAACGSGQIERAAKLIKTARHPMIFVGSGAIHAREAVLALGEAIDAPVVAFRGGRGIVGNDHELGLTIAAAYELWRRPT